MRAKITFTADIANESQFIKDIIKNAENIFMESFEECEPNNEIELDEDWQNK